MALHWAPMRPRLLALLCALATLLFVATAQAFTPPPLIGHVVDSAGVLRPDEVARLNQKLEQDRIQTGFAIVVFIPASLGGGVPRGRRLHDVQHLACGLEEGR